MSKEINITGDITININITTTITINSSMNSNININIVDLNLISFLSVTVNDIYYHSVLLEMAKNYIFLIWGLLTLLKLIMSYNVQGGMSYKPNLPQISKLRNKMKFSKQ